MTKHRVPKCHSTLLIKPPPSPGGVSCLGGFQIKSSEEEGLFHMAPYLETTQKGNPPGEGGFLSINM